MHYENCLHFLIAKVNQRINGIFKSRLQRFGLTPVQSAVLAVLYEEEGLSAGEIGMRLVLDSATISGILDRMEKDNWIIKKISPNDGRLLEISLTEKALKVREEMWSEIEACHQEALRPLKIEERILLERFLKDLR
ncbi:MAG TPA: MarR family transcriptional regulator [Syntrophales bacterium]|nr:MarR family transcriptional regulator [Syntrophales bacterium]HPN25616.1 MarR family transcriptional regulator [Syntrophales bacterium]HQM28126.1 MarR family transcriptional regulator [Syntrophales bacterium]